MIATASTGDGLVAIAQAIMFAAFWLGLIWFIKLHL